MKDEEMAEEWWNNWVVKDWNDLQKAKELFIQAYLVGLKTGRPQWHNLKENPNDLPKDNSLKQIYLGENNYQRAWYNKNENQWIVENDECCFYEYVEQWCDLPRL